MIKSNQHPYFLKVYLHSTENIVKIIFGLSNITFLGQSFTKQLPNIGLANRNLVQMGPRDKFSHVCKEVYMVFSIPGYTLHLVSLRSISLETVQEFRSHRVNLKSPKKTEFLWPKSIWTKLTKIGTKFFSPQYMKLSCLSYQQVQRISSGA